MGRPRKPHGTQAAYRAHKRDGSRVCDACQAWKDGGPQNPLKTYAESLPTPPAKPTKARKRSPEKLDPLADTLENLDEVTTALAYCLENDPGRVAALSKRRSELVAEVVAYGGAEDKAEKKLDKLLDAPAGGETADNVIGFRKATA